MNNCAKTGPKYELTYFFLKVLLMELRCVIIWSIVLKMEKSNMVVVRVILLLQILLIYKWSLVNYWLVVHWSQDIQFRHNSSYMKT